METPHVGYGPNVGESDVCRLCMRSHQYYLNVFVSNERFKSSIGKVIEELLMLEVAEGDSLPDTVCCPCVTKLMEFRDFKEMCVNSARELSRVEPFTCPVKVEIVEEEDEVVDPGAGQDEWNDEFVKDRSRVMEHSNDGPEAIEDGVAVRNREDDDDYGSGHVVVKKEYDEGATVFIESAAVAMRDESLVDEDDDDDDVGGNGEEIDGAGGVVVKRIYNKGAKVFIQSAAVDMRDECDVTEHEGGTMARVIKQEVMDNADSDEDYVPPASCGVDPLNVGQRVNEGDDSDGSEYSPENETRRGSGGGRGKRSRPPSSKDLKCDTCGKLFGRRSHLKRHALLHTGVKPHQCHLCGKSFAVLGYLRTHVATHAKKSSDQEETGGGDGDEDDTEAGIPTCGPAPKGTPIPPNEFECNICGKLFKQRCNVKRHLLLHTGLKPYKCSVCGKAFVDVFNLREHESTHLGRIFGPMSVVTGGLLIGQNVRPIYQ